MVINSEQELGAGGCTQEAEIRRIGVAQGVGPGFKPQYHKLKKKKRKARARRRWITPVILASWESEIGRIMIQGQLRQIVHETPPANLQNNQSKMDWRCGSSGRMPTLQCKALSSNPSPPPKKINTEYTRAIKEEFSGS
jgi:hypothetical protein